MGNQRRNHLLLSSPRTASNLLVTILNLENQPDIYTTERSKHGYFFLDSFHTRKYLFAADSPHMRDWTQEDRKKSLAAHQSCFESLRDHAIAAQSEGKFAYVKEHAAWLMNPVALTKLIYNEEVGEEGWTVKAFDSQTRSIGNDTLLPDEFLKGWMPTFLIRHPALVIPSFLRARHDVEGLEYSRKEWKSRKLQTSMKWSRDLYDWYCSQGTEEPIVLDADDIMTNRDIMVKYAKIIGADPTRLRFSWEVKPAEQDWGESTAAWKRMSSTLRSSSGVLEGKTSAGLVVEEEVEKWKEEFGNEIAGELETWVRDAMPHYEHMKVKRLT
ncbi:uncharacterized protein EAE97_011691 [Botrytis byssoidea]|uniref:Sulfotransferase domain-containing protein n=1 Tax=Botrytis byssoidea TaxID=139641 RepID=A0A9P5LRC9_9HELO|nr:uncharacterized protein EAE97_011691 [Botrytis byssoidea]KAF7919359.1 hypothetical protein EAE97_011691 [Botrytis byssoidea]